VTKEQRVRLKEKKSERKQDKKEESFNLLNEQILFWRKSK